MKETKPMETKENSFLKALEYTKQEYGDTLVKLALGEEPSPEDVSEEE